MRLKKSSGEAREGNVSLILGLRTGGPRRGWKEREEVRSHLRELRQVWREWRYGDAYGKQDGCFEKERDVRNQSPLCRLKSLRFRNGSSYSRHGP